ncbi:MAG: hypothetical protein VST71_08680 [Nitrospirota bacterium]|nr:hypothetical protein [Nitrospirota bacterium]
MNERFRKRLIKEAVKLGARKAIDHVSIFAEILDNNRAKGEEIKYFLSKFKGAETKTQNEQFIELIFRDDEVKNWAMFFAHENQKEESAWKSNIVKELADKLPSWSKKERNEYTDSRLEDNLGSFIKETSDIDINSFELRRNDFMEWRRDILRSIIRDILKGIAS